MGLGGVGIFQKPSNLVRYYTLGGMLHGLFYLPRKILCAVHDRAVLCAGDWPGLLLQHNIA